MIELVSMESDIEDKFLRIRDENLFLKKQVNEANNVIKQLNTRLNRLLEMKKRALSNDNKNKKMVSLDETIFNLQHQIGQLESENRKFRQRSLLLQTKLDAVRRRQYRSMYSSVPSRTDSGLEWVDSPTAAASHFSSKPSSARLTVHHRSSSTISLNRVTYNSSIPSTIQNASQHHNISSSDERVGSFNSSIKPIEEKLRNGLSVNKKDHQSASSEGHLYRQSVLADKMVGKNDFVLQLLRETQDEVSRLQEIIVLQQHAIDSLQYNVQGQLNESNQKNFGQSNGLIKSVKKEPGIVQESRKQTNESNLSRLTADNGTSIGVNCNDTQKIVSVCKMSSESITDFDKILTSKGIPDEIILHFEKLNLELVESQNIIKSLRSQLIKDNLATVKMVEMNQKLDQLTRENELLQKSLQNCIGTCISDLEKDCDQNYVHGNEPILDSSETDSDKSNKIVQHLEEKIKRLEVENSRQAQSLVEKSQLINLLQVKYNNLKDAYDLMITTSSRSPLSKSCSPKVFTKNGSRTGFGTSNFTFPESSDPDPDDRIIIVADNDNGVKMLPPQENRRKLQTRDQTIDQKGAILDSLGHVREMVQSVQSELENGLKLNDYQD